MTEDHSAKLPSAEAESAQSDSLEREAYEDSSALLPEVESFGWQCCAVATAGQVQAARAGDCFELHYIHSGSVSWWLDDPDQVHEVVAGQTHLVRPGQAHGARDDTLHPCEHYWLRMALPTDKNPLPGLRPEDSRQLRDCIGRVTVQTAHADKQVGKFFQMLLAEYRKPYDGLIEITARCILHTLLLLVVRGHLSARQEPAYSWRVKRVLDWLSQHQYCQDLRFEAMSSELGMGSSALRAQFKEETGYTPQEYVVQQRVRMACNYLQYSKKSVTDIAFMLGSSSSQYFATSFRKYTGLTPSEYRQRHRRLR